MIQRIQSVYILLALLATLATIFLPFATNLELSYSLLSAPEDMGTTIPVIFTFVAAIDILISLFLYKNRKLQQAICLMGIGSNLVILALAGYSVYQTMGNFNAGIALAMPVISSILLFLANRSIKKDEDLVRSVDRLR